METENKITGFKGFDKNLQCRGYQYEVGNTYEHSGIVKCCEEGFHFCENPLDVFGYYSPNESRYCAVEGSGTIDKSDEDSTVASSKLHISAEVGIKGIVDAGVKFILDKVNWKDCKESNTGDCSAATVEGDESIAIVTGKDGKAKGAKGCWIVLTERGEWNGEYYPIIDVKAFKVDDYKIKADTFYQLVNGEAVEIR